VSHDVPQPSPVRHDRAFRHLVPALGSVALSVVLLLLAAAPVLGHSELEGSDPADKAVLPTPPTTVTLTFSEALNGAKSSFRLSGPSGDVGTGKATEDGGTTMTLDGLSLPPGGYTIEWTSVAEDGDVLRGKLTFTVSDATPPPATPSAAPASPTAEPSTDPTSAATAVPSPSAAPATAASTGGDVIVPIVAGLVIVAIAGAWLLRRSRTA
jgi:copper resistance protein C